MNYAALCGMAENEFWDSTPRYMSARINALESAQKLSWEQSRFIAFFGNRASGKTLVHFYRFPWEKEAFAPVTREEWDGFSDDADETLKAINPGLYAQYMAGKLNRNGEGISES
jgi:hypothetical protein